MPATATTRRKNAPTRRRRRGGTTAQLVGLMAVFGSLGTAAVIIAPRALDAAGADDDASRIAAASSPEHQAVLELLARLLGESRSVLAVHERGESPYAELVLWLHDTDDSGTPDPDEIALVSHSRVTETIAVRALDPSSRTNTAFGPPNEPAFCRRFRTSGDVTSRVIARGISDMRVASVTTPHERPGRLQISLSWGRNSSDGPDKASTVVDVDMR